MARPYSPGSFMWMYEPPNSYAVVLASSGHRRTYNDATAKDAIRRTAHADGRRITRWEYATLFSHTAEIVHYGCLCDDPESQMCADGDGKAWRRIVIGVPETIEEEA